MRKGSLIRTNSRVKTSWTFGPAQILKTSGLVKRSWTFGPAQILWTFGRIKRSWTFGPAQILWTFGRIKRSWTFGSLLVAAMVVSARAQSNKSVPDYRKKDLAIEKRVEDLIHRMTLEEKVAQLQCRIEDVEGTDRIGSDGIGGLGCMLRPYKAREAALKLNRIQKFMVEKTRLGIPAIMHDEALHGLVGNGATSFPQAIGLAATWDPGLLEKVAAAIALETKSRGIRQVLSPVVNIARDVRWGRVEETYGEDPFLTARMGVAFCRPFEDRGVITTPKHFSANIGDGGRDSNPIHFSQQLFDEIYFPGFKACLYEGKATSVMAAYNSIDGIPCSCHKWLLTHVLREKWGFTGFVVSDYGSVGGIFTAHNVASSPEETAALALEAGCDVELPNVYYYGEPLIRALREGLVSEAVLDRSVKRVLAAKFRLGLFENPYADPEEAARVNDCKEHRMLALEAARKSLVLLKNEKQTLPFGNRVKRIAVLGPSADVVRLGGYSGYGMKTVSVLEGIRNHASPGTSIVHERGADLEAAMLPTIPQEFLVPAGPSSKEKGLWAEYFQNLDLSGRPVLVRVDPQVRFDWAEGTPDPSIKPDRFSVRWTGKFESPVSGLHSLGVATDDGVRLFIDGQCLIDRWVDRGTTADVVSFRFEKGHLYDIRMEYYENGGYAYAGLGWGVQQEEDDRIRKAVLAAQDADAAVIVAGIQEGEGRDRARLDLSSSQEALINAVAETNVPVVVVLVGGNAVTMGNWIDKVPAMIETWYGGEEGGNAVAEALFGKTNPGGRLPITFPQSVAQVPLYYNPKPSGRGIDYIEMSGKPLFPFGHGLSYTHFEYGPLTLGHSRVKSDMPIDVRVDVTNIGSIKGDEVVQLYIRDRVGSVSRPVQELRGFQRITLSPGETKTVVFTLTQEHLSMIDKDGQWIVEPGWFDARVGSSSVDIRQTAEFEIVP